MKRAITGMVPLLAVAACGQVPRDGTVHTLMTDAPLEDAGVTEVNVTVTQVVAHLSGGGDTGDTGGGGSWVVLVDDEVTVDLMQLRHGATEELDIAELPVGKYTMIRLHLSPESSIVVEGEEESLSVPSGERTGIKIPAGIEVEADVDYELLLDFDAEKSVHRAGSGMWMLKPVIRVKSFGEVEEEDTGDTTS